MLIHIGRLRSGRRKIFEIDEVLGFDGKEYIINPLFRYDLDLPEDKGLRMMHKLKNVDRLKSYGQYDNYCKAMECFYEKQEADKEEGMEEK